MALPKILRGVSRALGLGPVVLRYYHTPIARLRQSIAEGGPSEQRRTEQARREMIDAAKVLPPLTAPRGQEAVEIAFLSGEHFWWQTLFCVVSLQTHSPGADRAGSATTTGPSAKSPGPPSAAWSPGPG